MWNGALARDVQIGFGLDGWMIDHLTVGMLPSNSWAQLLTGVFLWPLFRLIAVAHTAYFDHICASEATRKAAGLLSSVKVDVPLPAGA